jgi:hypothetical protein
VDRKKAKDSIEIEISSIAGEGKGQAAPKDSGHKNGGWQEIEALREKAQLKASLADVWDEDFDLDDEILAELDHTAEFFTPRNSSEEEIPEEEDGEEEFFEDDEI